MKVTSSRTQMIKTGENSVVVTAESGKVECKQHNRLRTCRNTGNN